MQVQGGAESASALLVLYGGFTMNLIERIKQDENSPIYLAFALGALLGIIIGFLASPIKKGVTIGSYNNIENNEGCCKDEDEE
jgi:hypothetical protein